jgi:hypothetical protein
MAVAMADTVRLMQVLDTAAVMAAATERMLATGRVPVTAEDMVVVPQVAAK